MANGMVTSMEGSGGCTCLRGSLAPYMEVSYSLTRRNPPAVAFAMPDDTFDKKVNVKLANFLGYGDVRYTTDGSEPTASSAVYTNNGVAISKDTTIKAGVFNDGKLLGKVITRQFKQETSEP